MLTGNAMSRAVRCHILIDAALDTILVATTKETDEPKRDAASTNPETGAEEIRYTGQQQGTVDVTSVITEAKELYDKEMLRTFSVEEVCSAGVLERINGKLDCLS